MNLFFDWIPFRWSTDIDRWKDVGLYSYWATLPLQITLLVILYPGLKFIIFFILCNTDLLIEIRLDMRKDFSDGLENYIIELWDYSASARSIEKLPWSD